MVKRFLCNHPEGPWQQIWDEAQRVLVFRSIPPAEVVGCCSRNYMCPVCGFGVGEFPHDNCKGWDSGSFNSTLSDIDNNMREIYKSMAVA